MHRSGAHQREPHRYADTSLVGRHVRPYCYAYAPTKVGLAGTLCQISEFDKVKVQDSIPHGAVYRGISASADALIWGEVAMRGRADTPIYMSGHGTVYRLYRRIGARLFM